MSEQRALLATALEVKDHVTSVAYAFDDDTIVPHVRRAERDFVLPVLGRELYEDLLDHYQASASGSGADVLDDLLLKVQHALAHLAVRYAIPYLTVNVNDHGLHITQTENYRPPFQWQVGQLQNDLLDAGMSGLDDVYSYLEEHAGSLPKWTESTACTLYNDTLIRRASEFARHYPLNRAHVTFADLKAAMRRAQVLVIGNQIGQDFLDELLAHLQDESSSSDSGDSLLDTAIEKLQPALAHLTIGMAEELALRRVNGALMSTRTEANASTSSSWIDTKDPNNDEMKGIRRNAMATGQDFLALAHAWLDENADDLNTYKNGPGYRAESDQPDMSTRLHNKGGVVGL